MLVFHDKRLLLFRSVLVCAQCPFWPFSVVSWCHDFPVFIRIIIIDIIIIIVMYFSWPYFCAGDNAFAEAEHYSESSKSNSCP
jgi:hypothetical protein